MLNQRVMDRVNKMVGGADHWTAYALGRLCGAAMKDGLTDIPDAVLDAVCDSPRDADRIYDEWRKGAKVIEP